MHFISNIMLLLHFNFISIFPQQIKIYFFFLVRTGFSERFFIPLGSYLSRVFNPKSVVQTMNEMKEKLIIIITYTVIMCILGNKFFETMSNMFYAVLSYY